MEMAARRATESGEGEGLKKCPELTPPARRKPRLRGEKSDRTLSPTPPRNERTNKAKRRTKDEREYQDVILESVVNMAAAVSAPRAPAGAAVVDRPTADARRQLTRLVTRWIAMVTHIVGGGDY